VLYAYVEATVPKITLVTRKAIGGAYVAMGSKHLGCDLSLAWPSADIAVMGPEGAVNIVYRKQIEEAADKPAARAALVAEYKERFHTPYLAAARGYIDEVIEPKETRPRLIAALEVLADKQKQNPPKKHGVMPSQEWRMADGGWEAIRRLRRFIPPNRPLCNLRNLRLILAEGVAG